MKIRSLIFVAALAMFAGVGLVGTTVRAQTISGLSTPPHDSADAERVRIWFPRESAVNCRVTIDIVGDSNTVVRHLVDFLASKGYYNFYWDKRDDSGRRVPAGLYRYVLDNCGDKKTDSIRVQYSHWEKAIDFSPYDPSNPGDLTLTIAADSVPVSARICNLRGKTVDGLFADSVFNRGTYPMRIDFGKLGIRVGNFQIRVTAGDYTFIREISVVP